MGRGRGGGKGGIPAQTKPNPMRKSEEERGGCFHYPTRTQTQDRNPWDVNGERPRYELWTVGVALRVTPLAAHRPHPPTSAPHTRTPPTHPSPPLVWFSLGWYLQPTPPHPPYAHAHLRVAQAVVGHHQPHAVGRRHRGAGGGGQGHVRRVQRLWPCTCVCVCVGGACVYVCVCACVC